MLFNYVKRCLLILFLSPVLSFAQVGFELEDIKLPTQVQFIRVFGGDEERNPPVVLKPASSGVRAPFGEAYVTIEFDVSSEVPPILYARFVHCRADWEEDNNVFLNDVAFLRTSNIQWSSAPISSKMYNYRGVLNVPNDQVRFNYSGNWKVKIYEYGREEEILAEARFFVVEPKAEAELKMFSDFYEPEYRVAPSGLTMEAIVEAPQRIMDANLNTVVIYKNHRWYEPYMISMNSSYEVSNKSYKYEFKTSIGGFSSVGKMFRIEGVPAENGYRVLDMTNLAEFPRTNAPVRLPLSDIRRSGSFMFQDDDGAMISDFVTPSSDEYVYVEFAMDPENWISKDEVFLSGSFNNWNPNEKWLMYYDEDERLYKLRQWVRRARHNYLYATGRYDDASHRIEKLSYDEYEGNTVTTGQTYFAMVYYRETDFGGYDALIGLAASNIFGPIKR